ncbi:MAG TPA: DNA repair protein RecO [Acholeplasmataceae bacterium]|nr:DNA repair protein RecO [Acholeplasmataceae bacterium]
MNKITGLILKTQTYRETSRLLQTYTPLGKITLNAKGAEKINNKDRILSQYLTYIEFEYTEFKEFMTLKNAVIIDSYQKTKSNFQTVKYASLILEILERVTLGSEDHETIFNLAIEALNYQNIKISSLSFSLKMLYYLGYGIDLKGDGRKIKGVSINLGRLIYEEESYQTFLNYEQTIKLLKLTYTKINNLDDFDDIIIKTLKEFISKYYEYHLNIKLNALK